MIINGRDCTITIKTQYREVSLPYSEETIREAVSILKEDAAIEGGGVCGGIRKCAGVTGCVVTPLSIHTAPLLLGLCFGVIKRPVFVSETRNLYRREAVLAPSLSSPVFDLIQDRGGTRKMFEQCRVTGFELRIGRGVDCVPLKLKIDVTGDYPAVVYPYAEIAETDKAERFMSHKVMYTINGDLCHSIYGLRMVTGKKGGARTEVWLHRVLKQGEDSNPVIENLDVTARVFRDSYEHRAFGLFRLRLERLLLVSDETTINSADAVIGPERYYVAGAVRAELFTSGDDLLV